MATLIRRIDSHPPIYPSNNQLTKRMSHATIITIVAIHSSKENHFPPLQKRMKMKVGRNRLFSTSFTVIADNNSLIIITKQ